MGLCMDSEEASETSATLTYQKQETQSQRRMTKIK